MAQAVGLIDGVQQLQRSKYRRLLPLASLWLLAIQTHGQSILRIHLKRHSLHGSRKPINHYMY